MAPIPAPRGTHGSPSNTRPLCTPSPRPPSRHLGVTYPDLPPSSPLLTAFPGPSPKATGLWPLLGVRTELQGQGQGRPRMSPQGYLSTASPQKVLVKPSPRARPMEAPQWPSMARLLSQHPRAHGVSAMQAGPCFPEGTCSCPQLRSGTRERGVLSTGREAVEQAGESQPGF